MKGENKMKKLTIERANELKASGITHIASVVKSRYTTTYYHVNSIQDILNNGGRWIPAPINSIGWHGRRGITGSQVDWSRTILATQM